MEGLPIFEIPWLIAGLLALAVLFLWLALDGWRRRRKVVVEAKRAESYQLSPEEEMKTLGIVAVRRLEEQPAPPTPKRGDPEDDLVHLPFRSESPELNQQAAGIVDDLVEEDRRVEGTGGVPRFLPKRSAAPVGNAEPVSVGRHPGTYLDQGSPLWPASRAPSHPEADADAVAFLLESLWAAMHAQSVALLRFDEQASSYSVDALVSERVTRQISLFPAGGNVLNLVPDDTSISILEPGAFSALRYHANPMISVGHAVAIAVHGPRERVLLVADVEPGAEPFSRQSLNHFGDYADLLAKLLPKADPGKHTLDGQAEADPEHATAILQEAIVGTLADHTEDDSNTVSTLVETESAVESVVESATESTEPKHNFVFDAQAAAEEPKPDIKMPAFDPPDDRNGLPRPRNEIIAEEMAAARLVQEPLALALVVPRDAVKVAAQGSRAIAEAEKKLLDRLREVAGSNRVEPFGELVVGVFCKAGPAFVEAWVERVEHSGPAVQIGVALLRARHRTPKAFRADAETALREAYERKEDCVIVE